VLVLLVVSVYDPRYNLHAADEFQRASFGVLLAALGFAGLLYLTVREVSRWLFLTFVLLDLLLLLGWRAVARLAWRISKAPRPAARSSLSGRESWGSGWPG